MNIDHCFETRIKLYAIGYNIFKDIRNHNSIEFTDFENITGLSEILIPFIKDNDCEYYGSIKNKYKELYCFKELDGSSNLNINVSNLYKEDIPYFNFIVEIAATDLGNNVPGNIKLLKKIYIIPEVIDNTYKNIQIKFERTINNEKTFIL